MANPANELRVDQQGAVRRLTLARPERRNALTRSLVGALHREFAGIAGGETRVVVLQGEGLSFCAGADIGEFADAAATNLALSDAEGLADLLEAMAACPAPIVARVHGAAFGGGVGLVCAADLAVAAAETRFSLSEARLGLVPAVISPFVVRALGAREATARMLLAAPFDAEEALRIGLVQRVAPAEDLDDVTAEIVANLLRCAPGALAAIKQIPAMVTVENPRWVREATTALLAERLACAEGQEGLRAFLEKRSPAWALAETERV
jgi:methylglutaconyl-CoA hydratase